MSTIGIILLVVLVVVAVLIGTRSSGPRITTIERRTEVEDRKDSDDA